MTPDSHSSFDALLREAAELRVPAGRPIELPKPGTVLVEKYRVEEKLAEGGMGAVFRAANVETGKEVAIKWLLGQTPQAGLRFSREARAAARIDHPNVVNVFDSGSHNGGRFLVMELLRGESLGTRIRRARLPADELVEIMIPVLHGLAAAHRADVIHRDLKPDNIFLCVGPDGAARQPKVLDFGISKLRDAPAIDERLTGQGTGLGTLAYMSPEQLVDALNVDVRTDIYAAGAMMYEALTGCLPFRADGYNALVLAVAAQRPLPISALVSDVPRALERIVMRAMAREARERPDLQTLIAELEALRGACAIHAVDAMRPRRAAWRGWAWTLCLGLPLAVSIWFADHPPSRTSQAAPPRAAVSGPQQKPVPRAPGAAPSAQASGASEGAAGNPRNDVEHEPARTVEGGPARSAPPARMAGAIQTRVAAQGFGREQDQARAPARSRAGKIRWSDLY